MRDHLRRHHRRRRLDAGAGTAPTGPGRGAMRQPVEVPLAEADGLTLAGR